MKNHTTTILLTMLLLLSAAAYGQGIAINEDGAAPDPSAMLEVTSTEKGVLIPRMTQAQREAISAPANGLLIFQTDETSGFYFNAGTTGDPLWQRLGDEVSLPSGSAMQTLRHDGAGWVSNSLLKNNGTALGVGTNPIANNQLYLFRPFSNFGAGYANIYARREGDYYATTGGTSWSHTGVDAAIKGFSNWGNNYTAAVAGYSYLDYENSAAVIGSNSGGTYGALAFKDDENALWAGYFNGSVNITGAMRIQGGEPGDGKVLTSDVDGNATWEPPFAMPSGSNMQTLRHDGAGWDANSLLRNNGTGLGVNANPQANTQLYLFRPIGNFGAGYANIYARREGNNNAAPGGTSWGLTGCDAAIKGFSNWGNNFSAALAGYSYFDYANSAAVIGCNSTGGIYGALAFKDEDNTLWAGYFNGNVNVTGIMHIQGGSPGEGKVLTSDATGTASWQHTTAIVDPALSCIDIDGNAYPTIVIGDQIWMAENLRVTKYRNGNSIPNITGDAAWEATTNGAYCWYNNNKSANAKYGAMYNWHAVNDSRGLCPDGWRVPTDAEWTSFTNRLGGLGVAGGKLKSVSALWDSPNTDATNSSGFSALSAGIRSSDGSFWSLGSTGYWWSSTESYSTSAWYRYMSSSSGSVGRHNNFYKTHGFSIRCLKD